MQVTQVTLVAVVTHAIPHIPPAVMEGAVLGLVAS